MRKGTRLFEPLAPSPRLDLISATTFANEITELAFRTLR
jgi:hypothetical protein